MNTGVPLGGHTLWRVTSPRISLGVSYATTNVQHRNTVMHQLMHKGCKWRFEENIDYSETSIKRTAKELGKWVPFVPFSSRPSQVETAVLGCNSWLSVWLDHVVILSFLRSYQPSVIVLFHAFHCRVHMYLAAQEYRSSPFIIFGLHCHLDWSKTRRTGLKGWSTGSFLVTSQNTPTPRLSATVEAR